MMRVRNTNRSRKHRASRFVLVLIASTMALVTPQTVAWAAGPDDTVYANGVRFVNTTDSGNSFGGTVYVGTACAAPKSCYAQISAIDNVGSFNNGFATGLVYDGQYDQNQFGSNRYSDIRSISGRVGGRVVVGVTSDGGSTYTTTFQHCWGSYSCTGINDQIAQPPLPLCTTTQLYDSAASLSGTTLTLRARIQKGYLVGIALPDAGDNSAIIFTLGDSNAVDGSPGYVYGSGQYSGSSMSGLLFILQGTTRICKSPTGVGTAAIRSDGSSTGATDPTAGNNSQDCGWNPFCYIKSALAWAFIPGSSSLNQWTNLQSNLTSKPPFSLVSSCTSFITTIFSSGSDNQTGITFPSALNGDYYVDNHHLTFAPMLWANQEATTNGYYLAAMSFVKVVLWSFFAWWAYNRITASFGGKEV